MGWGPNPIEQQAAEQAAAEARERLANRPLTPFEKQLLGVLDDIREELHLARPVPLEPIVGTAEGLVSLPVGAVGDLLIEQLLDSDPTDLSLAIDAGATALANTHTYLTEDYTRSWFEKIAETVIDAALKDTARRYAERKAPAEGQAAAPAEEGAAGGDSLPPAAQPTE